MQLLGVYAEEMWRGYILICSNNLFSLCLLVNYLKIGGGGESEWRRSLFLEREEREVWVRLIQSSADLSMHKHTLGAHKLFHLTASNHIFLDHVPDLEFTPQIGPLLE